MKIRNIRALCLFSAIALSSLLGCQRYQFSQSPLGTVHEQRVRATIHDPWPDNDVAPEIVGGRPREFEKPQAEAERIPLYQETYGSFGR